MVAGLAFGDEGKGSVVDFLTRDTGAQLVVRFCGGPQACHAVVTPEGITHQFHQFGSGSLVRGTGTYLSRFMLVEPLQFIEELKALSGHVTVPRVMVERGCPIITPFHWITNQARETARGDKAHGSCGWGIGEVRMDQLYPPRRVITIRDFEFGERSLVYLLEEIRDWRVKTIRSLMVESKKDLSEFEFKLLDVDTEWLASFYVRDFLPKIQAVQDDYLKVILKSQKTPVIFEGAQGMLIDENHGFHPHTTWTNCTFENVNQLLAGVEIDKYRIGVLRTYLSRHGAGPFITESSDVCSFNDHNKTGKWNGPMRYGKFDIPAAKYALKCIKGVDGLALTHLDQFEKIPAVVNYGGPSYADLSPDASRISHFKPGEVKEFEPDALGAELGVPICLESRGQTAEDKKWKI
jgi:adenylosuccinate synthase